MTDLKGVDSEVYLRAVEAAHSLADCLEQRQTDRVVFAESCTAGLVAALLGQCPGISSWLCGSAVTYRESVKRAWVSVSEKTLTEFTAESLETTTEMAIGVLRKTKEANFAAAVTGHLGPGAPNEIDGRIFIVVAKRNGSEIVIADSQSLQLKQTSRVGRQFESATMVLRSILAAMQV